jgi:hypothetical protein
VSPIEKTLAGTVTPPVVMLICLPASDEISVYPVVLEFCGTERTFPILSETEPGADIFPDPSAWVVLDAASVRKTSFVPAEKLTADPEFEDDRTVVRAKTFVDEYVPRPTSHSEVP